MPRTGRGSRVRTTTPVAPIGNEPPDLESLVESPSVLVPQTRTRRPRVSRIQTPITTNPPTPTIDPAEFQTSIEHAANMFRGTPAQDALLEYPEVFRNLDEEQIKQACTFGNYLCRTYQTSFNRDLATEQRNKSKFQQIFTDMEHVFDIEDPSERLNLVNTIRSNVSSYNRDLSWILSYLGDMINITNLQLRARYLNNRFLFNEAGSVFRNYKAKIIEGFIHFTTGEISITSSGDTVVLGPFEFRTELSRISPGHDTDNFTFSTLREDRKSTNGYIHMHISGGRLCPGDTVTGISRSFPHALNDGRIVQALDLIVAVLSNYNSRSPYCQFHFFIANRVCTICQSRIRRGRTRICHVCNRPHCDNCSTLCADCNNYSCRSCLGGNTCVCRRNNTIVCPGCHGNFLQSIFITSDGLCTLCHRRWVENNILTMSRRGTNSETTTVSATTTATTIQIVPRVNTLQVAPETQPQNATTQVPRVNTLMGVDFTSLVEREIQSETTQASITPTQETHLLITREIIGMDQIDEFIDDNVTEDIDRIFVANQNRALNIRTGIWETRT